MRREHSGRKTLAGLSVIAAVLAAASCDPAPGTFGLGRESSPVYSSNGACKRHVNPVMPTATGAQTPTGFNMEMPGAVLAPAAAAPTLEVAYKQFNDMTCSNFVPAGVQTPPRFYNYDAMGFIDYTLQKATPTAWKSVVAADHLTGATEPTALQLLHFLWTLNVQPKDGWYLGLSGLHYLRPGDVIAWQPVRANGATDTSKAGHVALVMVAPKMIPRSNGTRWEVVIMDSTAGGHGPFDTRMPASPLSQRNAPLTRSNGTTQASGLGIGTIVFDADRFGGVGGVEWFNGAHSQKIIMAQGHPLG